ncbi:DUF4410 domain-containing protein (plasmid) [Paraburkholderia sp. PREW-6R]|uniref:DUF4410 domain-containing protein n=1 Tax=Paraburkholderia sp. PREW-6R TaxID=3141544 RepID=UPI0031F566A1
MQTSYILNTSFIRRAKYCAATALVTASLLLSGVASAAPAVTEANATLPIRADVIYVYSFDATPDQVKLDSGMASKLSSAMSGESSAQQQYQTALTASDQVADEIVRELQSKGLHAERAQGPAPAGQSALIVEGSFNNLDEGKRRRRMLIGFGAGKSEVGASVNILYKPADGAPIPLQSFSADANSGHMPGIATTAGVGAAAGRVATTAATGASLHGVSEVKHNGVSADVKKLGDSIAKQIVETCVANGWMPDTQAH